MTFEQIAKELGVSPQRVYQIFDRALTRAKVLADKEGVTLEEVVKELEGNLTMYEALEEGLIYDGGTEEDLRGFWKEENNT